ncbi:MAG: InlB B-repeat-containing protein, partial [Lachnospiraceae bacterium]|nr:InlB B-repeat-containing protein [Lachnospiraceae bacterium]
MGISGRKLGDPYGEMPVLYRDGWTFLGWYDAIMNGNKVEEDTVITNPSEHTLYAYWNMDISSFLTDNSETIVMETGEKRDLRLYTASLTSDSYGWYARWESGDSKVVSVDNETDSEVRAVGAGTAVVTAYLQNGAAKYEWNISVTKAEGSYAFTLERPEGLAGHILSAKYIAVSEDLGNRFSEADAYQDAKAIDLQASSSASLEAEKGQYVYIMVETDEYTSLQMGYEGRSGRSQTRRDDELKRKYFYTYGFADDVEKAGGKMELCGVVIDQPFYSSVAVGKSLTVQAQYYPAASKAGRQYFYLLESQAYDAASNQFVPNFYLNPFTESRNTTGKFTITGKKSSQGTSGESVGITVCDTEEFEKYGKDSSYLVALYFWIQVSGGSSSSDKTDISSAVGYAPSAYANKQSTVSVTLDGKALKAGTDYALSCDSSAVTISGGKVSASAEGTYVLKATGAGKYEGSVEFPFTVLPASEKMVDLKKQGVITNLPKSVPYSGASYDTLEAIGAAAGADVHVALKDGTRLGAGDYAVSVTKGLNKGTATIQVSGQGRYTGTLKKTFKIAAFDLAANAGGAVSVSMAEEAEFSKGGAIP